MTAHNNPSLQLFLTATLPEYRLEWPTGADKLLLVSVGTGFLPAGQKKLSRLRRHIIYVATSTPSGLMFAAANHNDVACRSLGQVRFGRPIDSELGDLTAGLATKHFSYARYNIAFEPDELAGYGVTADPRELARLDAVEHIETLMELGTAYGQGNSRGEALRRLHPAAVLDLSQEIERLRSRAWQAPRWRHDVPRPERPGSRRCPGGRRPRGPRSPW